MLRLTNEKDKQRDIWEAILPKELLQLNEELTIIDNMLNDERFFSPILTKFNTKMGRPTVPVSTYLRMMYLKHRYQLGYEILVKEVKDSFMWRRFCHLRLHDTVPDSTTLIKLTKKYGAEIVESINKLLVQKLKEQKVIRGKKLRIDTTVVESDIHYPTDIGLLADGVRLITRIVKKIKSTGLATRTKFQDRTRIVKKTILRMVKVLKHRTGKSVKTVKQHAEKMLDILRQVCEQAQAVQKNAGRKINDISHKSTRSVRKLRKELTRVLQTSTRIIKQTEKVLSGDRSIPHRAISFFDTEARPIRKGSLSKPTEFGRKVVIQEAERGIVTGYRVVKENPEDSTLLRQSVRSHADLFGRSPPEIATDRGFYSSANERWLRNKGVRKISIPVRGKKDKERKEYERQFWFRRLQKFRAGGEAKISLLKRKFGMGRSKMRGTEGTQIWAGWSIMAHNLWQTARVI